MGHKVKLALYDLSGGIARSMSMPLLGKQIDGIWHTGIIVYGNEYFYGGGLQCMPHQAFAAQYGGSLPCQYIELGETDVPEEVFKDFIRDISPRFTPSTYDLLRWNCNNFTDEASKFLLNKGIPQHIVNLPNEVMSTPFGQMLRPMMESMTQRMTGTGGDPFAAAGAGGGFGGDPFAHVGQARAGQGGAAGGAGPAQPTPQAAPVPPPAAFTRSASIPGADQVLATSGYPMLEKHSKPLLSANASAASAVIFKLRTTCEEASTLSAEEAQRLSDVGAAVAKGPAAPLPQGAYDLLIKVLWDGPNKAEFAALCVLRLMVLHKSSGREDDDGAARAAVVVVGKLARGCHSDQGLAMALCAAANMFARPQLEALMLQPDYMTPCLDAGLRDLRHTRPDVRQLASALLHNYSLSLTNGGKAGGDDITDEGMQLLLGVLEEVDAEQDGMVALRRLLCAGRVLRAFSPSAAALASEVGLGLAVEEYVKSHQHEEQAKLAAEEVVRLLSI